MVKKQQKTAAPKPAKGRRKDAAAASAKAADTPFAEQVKASAQQIWSAGLAAFAKAQDQGGAMLDKLSGDSAKAQDPMRGAGEKLDSAARRMSDLAGEVGSRAGQHWDKLESIFEDRVARALARLGMPAAEEVARLQARVEALAAEVAMLRAQAAPGAKAQPAKPAKSRKAESAKSESPKTESPKTKAPKARTVQAAKSTKAAKAAKARARTT
jgi:poly(hydroxyalkanoate) granule-associated protein